MHSWKIIFIYPTGISSMSLTENTVSEGFLQGILENSYDGIVIVDGKNVTRYVSPSVTAMHGYKPDEIIGGPAMKVVHPDDIAYIQELFSTVLSHPGETFKGEFRIVTKKGSKKNLSCRVTNMLDNPAVQGIVVNFSDISDQLKAEENLRKSEKQYSLIVEKGNDGILLAQENLVVYANNTLFNLLGYTKDEAIGTPFIQYVATKYQKLTAKRFRQRMQGLDVPNIYEIELVAKDGRYIPVEINAAKAEYDGKPASIVVIRDIRKRKEAEKTAREAVATSKVILNATTDLMALFSPDERVIDCNEAFVKSLGKTRKELIGKNARDFLPPDVYERRAKSGLQSIEEKKPISYTDSRDGRWFETRQFPIINEEGKVTQVAFYIRDITEEKQMREKLLEQQKLAALGQISSVIAHELNTPLATIDLTAQMLGDVAGKELLPDVETIQSEVKRASVLVADILGFTSMRPLDYGDVNIKEIVENVLKSQQQLHDVAHVTFDVALSDAMVHGDADKLGMVFENVIKNALLARVSPHKPHTVSIRESVDDGNVVVTVRDTGVGIDEKDIQNIFKPFFTTRERGSGSGLGLYIAEWVIQNHDGHILAESIKGEGSTFTIAIPKAMATES